MIFESKTKKIPLDDLNIYDLLYFNEILKYIFYDRKETEEKRVKNNKYFIYYQINDLNKYKEIFQTHNNLINNCVLLIYFNCNTFKEMLIKVELHNDKNNEILNIVLNKMYNYLLKLKDNMKNNLYVENYFFETFQLSHGSFSDYYKFNFIELDFGKKQNKYSNPIIVKTKMKYKIILNNNFKDFGISIDTLNIDREIYLNLIQLFLRTIFEKVTNGIYYNHSDSNFFNKLNTTNVGKLIKYNRNTLIEFQDELISDDIDSLFQYFNTLNYDDKCVFLQACEAYLEALKSNNGKEIMFFVISLETLANYEYNDSHSKSEKIFNLIKKLYSREVAPRDYIDYIYDLRSLYSHQGISNNKIKQNIFNIFENSKRLISEVEKLTYSSLIKWLIYKGETYGK